MSRRKTIEEFVAQARARHGDTYDYSKVKYISGHKKVIIVCPVHGDFEQTPNNHLSGGSSKGAGCLKCSWGVNRQTEEQFILRSQKIHENKYDYSKVNYVNSYTKVIIGCPVHGEFTQAPDTHTRQRAGCRECHFERKRETLEGFITRAREIHGDRYDYSKAEYKGSLKNLTIICPEHGEFEQLPTNHLSKRASGCRFCAWEDNGHRRRKTTNEFIEGAIETHGNLYDYSKVEYTLGKSKVKIVCKKHGEFEQIADNHLWGSGCPRCSPRISKSEELLRKILEEIFSKHGNFKFPNVRPKWLVNPNTNHRLELDCYNDKLQLAFEYQGWLHYQRPPEQFGGQVGLIKQRRRDHFKRFQCHQHNVILVEIKGTKLNALSPSKREDALRAVVKDKLNKIPTEQKQQLMKRLKGDKT